MYNNVHKLITINLQGKYRFLFKIYEEKYKQIKIFSFFLISKRKKNLYILHFPSVYKYVHMYT